jgi:hypothetical protein
MTERQFFAHIFFACAICAYLINKIYSEDVLVQLFFPVRPPLSTIKSMRLLSGFALALSLSCVVLVAVL